MLRVRLESHASESIGSLGTEYCIMTRTGPRCPPQSVTAVLPVPVYTQYCAIAGVADTGSVSSDSSDLEGSAKGWHCQWQPHCSWHHIQVDLSCNCSNSESSEQAQLNFGAFRELHLQYILLVSMIYHS